MLALRARPGRSEHGVQVLFPGLVDVITLFAAVALPELARQCSAPPTGSTASVCSMRVSFCRRDFVINSMATTYESKAPALYIVETRNEALRAVSFKPVTLYPAAPARSGRYKQRRSQA